MVTSFDELSDDDIESLPTDLLAIRILDDAVRRRGAVSDNAGTWFLDPDIRQRNAGSRRAFKEAWGWLYANHLIVADLERQTTPHQFVLTRLGQKVLTDGLGIVRTYQRLAIDLHPRIAEKVRPQYLMGEFELAAFAALRAVEVRVRELIQAPESLIGQPLIDRAFGEDGPFWHPDRDRGEQIGRINLFKGAIGYLKNPTSHREVFYDNDPEEAAEVIMLADLLLRIVDRVEAERGTT